MAERYLSAQYRLRRFAIQLKEFTVSDLGAAANVSPETVHNFLFELRKLDPAFVDQAPLKSEGAGRPPLRYSLKPKALQLLASRNLELAKELNAQAFQEDPSLQPAPVADRQKTEPKPRIWDSLFPCRPEPAFVLSALQPEWNAVSELGACGVRVKAGRSAVRIWDELRTLPEPVRTKDELREITEIILTPWQKDLLRARGSVTCAYHSPHHGAIGLKVDLVRGEPQLQLRQLPAEIPKIEDLYLPSSVLDFSNLRSGLILTTGIGASGRSRTIAALLDRINETQKGLVATIEEPILYMHEQKQCIFEQKQVGLDTPDFSTALTESLEESPNVVVLSDVTEPNAFATALAAAERSLVVCRVTAGTAIEAIQKLVELSSPAERATIRSRIAATLAGTISLTALRRADGKGLVYAAEVLRIDNAARGLIADETKIHSLPEYLERTDPGSQTFRKALENLHNERLIDEDLYLRHSCAGV